jgi:hypothetical protein
MGRTAFWKQKDIPLQPRFLLGRKTVRSHNSFGRNRNVSPASASPCNSGFLGDRTDLAEHSFVLTAHETNDRSRMSINRNCALGGLSGDCAAIHWQVDASDEAALVG